jgi:hypothetical protein
VSGRSGGFGFGSGLASLQNVLGAGSKRIRGVVFARWSAYILIRVLFALRNEPDLAEKFVGAVVMTFWLAGPAGRYRGVC